MYNSFLPCHFYAFCVEDSERVVGISRCMGGDTVVSKVLCKECKEEVHHGGTKTRRRGSENLSKIGILSTFSERLRLEGEEKWGIGKSTQVVAMTSFPCPPEYKLLANMGCARIRGDHRFAKTLFSSFFSVSPW